MTLQLLNENNQLREENRMYAAIIEEQDDAILDAERRAQENEEPARG